jgi:hypothetical protein
MAFFSLDEFQESLEVLAEGGPTEKLRDRLARLNAFHSRRGLNSLRSLAERLYALSSGLRRDVAPTRAFQALWMEYIGHRLTEKSGQKLDELAEAINSHLHEDGAIKDGEQEALEKALDEYEDLLARKVGGVAARLDTLQKAVPAVAAILRARPRLDVPLDAPEEDADHEGHDHDHAHGHHDHHHHDHAHDHDHDHDHDEAHDHGHDDAAAAAADHDHGAAAQPAEASAKGSGARSPAPAVAARARPARADRRTARRAPDRDGAWRAPQSTC